MSKGKEFLKEGADYLDAAVDFEDSKNRLTGAVYGAPLLMETVKNLMHLRDKKESGFEIGKYLSDTYNKEDFELFVKHLREGFERGEVVENFEKEEMKALNEAFRKAIPDREIE